MAVDETLEKVKAKLKPASERGKGHVKSGAKKALGNVKRKRKGRR